MYRLELVIADGLAYVKAREIIFVTVQQLSKLYRISGEVAHQDAEYAVPLLAQRVET